MTTSGLRAFEARDDLKQYGDNGLMLFALELAMGLEDIQTVASTALTDGSNDKKCDLVYVDVDRERIVVAQGYHNKKGRSKSAPANKASDLNTAVTWLLSGPLERLPDTLQSAATEVRDALKKDSIRQFDLWYVHNLPESSTVDEELRQAAKTARSLVTEGYPEAQLSVAYREVGTTELDEMYRRTEVSIAVSESYDIPVDGGFEVKSDKWSAFCTSVSGEWLQTVWSTHEADLMSPNVRNYLGIVRSERNINYNIKTTARQEPEQFWIYNNGLTILVNNYSFSKDGSTLTVDGLGIINGAQTTGSIGTLLPADSTGLDRMRVMARFVKCGDPAVLADIIKFNNTQNKIEATDFRSKDATQDRLRQEFLSVPDADYRGGRRGGVRDAIERSKYLLPDGTVAQSLAAFHGRPSIAYNEKSRIWNDDGVYSQFFSDRTSARHIVFAYSLLRAVEEAKKQILDIPEERRKTAQTRYLQYLRRRGSIPLLVAGIGSSIETILDVAVPDKFRLRFKKNCKPSEGIAYWRPIVDATLPFSGNLESATESNMRSGDRVDDAVSKFQAMIESSASMNPTAFQDFAKFVDLTFV